MGNSDASMLGFAAAPLAKVRVAFVGLGYRGLDAVERFTHIEDARITALCDTSRKALDAASALCPFPPNLYEDYKAVCDDPSVDLVYIATPWTSHTEIALRAMRCGKHVAVEVPAALTIEDCWALVETSEQTRRHCMMLENAVYDRFTLSCLNMARYGLFGELVYAEGGYIHDLDPEKELWRIDINRTCRGDLYPTHGLGPVALVLGIHRGDRMRTLVSLDTAAFNGAAVSKRLFGSGDYANGDHTTTLIRTEKGKAIELQHNVMDPRPYDRGFQLTGTLGYAREYPVGQFYFKGDAAPKEGSECEKMLSRYTHPITPAPLIERARGIGHHDGMDFIMDYRLVYCLHNGLPLDMDVYDAAEWSSVIELSAQSLRCGSSAVEVPDFTRGRWGELKEVDFKLN